MEVNYEIWDTPLTTKAMFEIPENYDTDILYLYLRGTATNDDFLNLIRNGDTWRSTGWRIKPSGWNWLLTFIGMERYEEVGEWYWADGRKSNSFNQNDDTFTWEMNKVF